MTRYPSVPGSPGEVQLAENSNSAGTVLDAYAIRSRLRIPPSKWMPPTQAEFAVLLGVPVATVRDWEQGRRRPQSAARTLLALLDVAPAETLALLAKVERAPV